MRLSRWALCGLLVLWVPWAFADFRLLSIDELMGAPETRAVLDPRVKFLWGEQQLIDAVERAPEDSYTQTHHNDVHYDISECRRAFRSVLTDIIVDAKLYDFDQAYLRASPHAEAPAPGKHQIVCDNGFHATQVVLLVSFGMSKGGYVAREARRNDPVSAAAIASQIAKRKAAGKTVFLPLSSAFGSAEAKAMLGQGARVYWGNALPPPYAVRKGPSRYEEDVRVNEHGRDKACKAAALVALKGMVEDMREAGFDAIVRVHSRLNDLPAPEDEYECKLDDSTAEVRLFATLVKTK